MARPPEPQSPCGMDSLTKVSLQSGGLMSRPDRTPSQPADVAVWNRMIMPWLNVSKPGASTDSQERRYGSDREQHESRGGQLPNEPRLGEFTY